ncbi:hypothetical protein PBAL39_01377 [Pedobacter sp. BAL39]|uniref:beta-1,6-N-acetylglucosaminyltransferase n=1 Tax=Pedobacter sp. BAL39 TaxID=391596 RepID=UPI00015594B2|nr:beta-1,6-N-acetylglucosaminyltransferase [Pedobacter sp. BAL39]EDM38224.1 hypothetical protein PBAL39_01377 [Pedobacter sp. BAL39]
MKAAVLILAHKNVWQLQQLVNRLSEDFDVYIHADAKWELDESLFKNDPNVFMVKRHIVNWGSYHQILATLELFNTSFKKDYDYYMLISGLDLPVKSNIFIKNFMENNLTRSFVNSESLPKKAWAGQNGGFDRIDYYFGLDFNTGVDILKRKAFSFIQRLQRKYGFRRKRFDIEFYGGWNWVNLNREAMQYLMNFLKEKPAFLKSFKNTYCADEIWLQTVLLNGPLEIVNNNYRYTSWEDHASHPKLLTMQDLEALKQSEDLFARKFDEQEDRKVIEAVYQMTK